MSILDQTSDIHARLAAAEAALKAVGQRIDPVIAQLDIAVLIPCCNNAATVGDVVRSFRSALQNARVYVYDNNSHDNTSVLARDAGAVVRREPLQGKGFVVRRMFADIEADVYLMVDGDGASDAAAAPRLVSRLIEMHADMVVGGRINRDKSAYQIHQGLGEGALTKLVSLIFGEPFTDMLSGYRAFSRRFVKSFPAPHSGFGTEIELTVHALELGMITTEVQAPCAARPAPALTLSGAIRDGARTLRLMARLVRDHRPMAAFGGLAALGLAAAGVTALAGPAGAGSAPVALAVISGLSLAAGVILGAVSLGRREARRLAYNQIESLPAKLERLTETRFTLESLRTQALAENQLAGIVRPKRAKAN